MFGAITKKANESRERSPIETRLQESAPSLRGPKTNVSAQLRDSTPNQRQAKPSFGREGSPAPRVQLRRQTDTALRDIQELLERHILVQNEGGGRSTSYRLGDPASISD